MEINDIDGMDSRDRLREARRIVVKVGTSTLTHASGELNLWRIEKLIRQLVDEMNAGREIVLVTSAAIAAGRSRTQLKPESVPEKQALAAVGQCMLMHIYEKIFAEYGKIPAQILLTGEDARNHERYVNSRNALLTLLSMGVVPVVNENDVVSVAEIKIGDNDTLSATVATIIDADALVILSDIDGVYTANPAKDPTARLIDEIREITPAVEEIAGGAGTERGTGGMRTKIEAAKIAMSAGVTMLIADGCTENVLRRALSGEKIGTVFSARESHLRLRKSYLAFGKRIAGSITVDAGCERAMREGASVLAAGITAVEGEFSVGASARVLNDEGREIARGSVNYDSDTMRKIIGKKTEEFAAVLGNADDFPDTVIHRDNLVMIR